MKIQLPLRQYWVNFLQYHQIEKLIPHLQPYDWPQNKDLDVAKIMWRGGYFLTEQVEQIFHQVECKFPINYMRIKADKKSGNPLVELRKRYDYPNLSWPVDLPDSPMPKNIADFRLLKLSYYDTSVHKFLQKFQQNSMLENVNLSRSTSLSKDALFPTLSLLLPLIGSINSFQRLNMQANPYGPKFDGEMKRDEYSQMMLKMLEKTRILEADSYDAKIEWCTHWLYTPREDGKPRMLILQRQNSPHGLDLAKISNSIERIKVDFLAATSPISFFMKIFVDGNIDGQAISLDNTETNEKLLIKTINPEEDEPGYSDKPKVPGMLLFSRYPMEASKKWVRDNEKEILGWNFDKLKRKIYFDAGLNRYDIPNTF